MSIEDIKVFLPKYLSPGSEKILFDCLRDFPDNIDSRLYSSYLEEHEMLFQGDGIRNLLLINLPDTSIKPGNGMVLSNTCDMHSENIREIPTNIIYAPIFSLNRYIDLMSKSGAKSKEQITSHLVSIKKQMITQIFYLPGIVGSLEESIVFLDRIINCQSEYINRKELKARRIFILSDYGAYLFVLKLSIHFCRINDKINRVLNE